MYLAGNLSNHNRLHYFRFTHGLGKYIFLDTQGDLKKINNTKISLIYGHNLMYDDKHSASIAKAVRTFP